MKLNIKKIAEHILHRVEDEAYIKQITSFRRDKVTTQITNRKEVLTVIENTLKQYLTKTATE